MKERFKALETTNDLASHACLICSHFQRRSATHIHTLLISIQSETVFGMVWNKKIKWNRNLPSASKKSVCNVLRIRAIVWKVMPKHSAPFHGFSFNLFFYQFGLFAAVRWIWLFSYFHEQLKHTWICFIMSCKSANCLSANSCCNCFRSHSRASNSALTRKLPLIAKNSFSFMSWSNFRCNSRISCKKNIKNSVF